MQNRSSEYSSHQLKENIYDMTSNRLVAAAEAQTAVSVAHAALTRHQGAFASRPQETAKQKAMVAFAKAQYTKDLARLQSQLDNAKRWLAVVDL